MKTVKEVSKITDISIRTLRYYDEIGLLKPAQLTEAGYRLYDDKALERLQEIMFFRELEIPLVSIKEMMDNSEYNKEQALLTQKVLLEHKRNRLNGIIELIDDVRKGVNTMSFKEFTEGDIQGMVANLQKGLSEEQFQEFLQKYGDGSIEAYEEKLRSAMNDEKTKASMLKWYGSKEKVIEGQKPIPNMEDLRTELANLHKEFATHIEGCPKEEEYNLVARLGNSYKQMLHLDNARAFLLDLAKEYLQDEKLAEAQDSQYGKGTAKYMAEAIQRYYGV